MNRVWLLQPIIPDGGEWAQPFGKMNAFVTFATNEGDARALASIKSKAEGPEVWLDPDETSCVELTPIITHAGIITCWQHIPMEDDDHGKG